MANANFTARAHSPDRIAAPALIVGATVRTIITGRTGMVAHVYPDNSASICWRDSLSVGPDLGHERMPRALLEPLDDSSATCIDARAICIRALRAAALASTDREALDVCGVALRQLAELARKEMPRD